MSNYFDHLFYTPYGLSGSFGCCNAAVVAAAALHKHTEWPKKTWPLATKSRISQVKCSDTIEDVVELFNDDFLAESCG